MGSSRPPRAAVRAAVRAALGDLDAGERVVVALSGGADSLALTAAAVAVCADLGLLCEAVVIDHQLQEGSGEVATRAAEQARILGCATAAVLVVEVPRGSGSGGVEAAARSARYEALDAAAGVDDARGRDEGSSPSAATGAGGAFARVPPAAAVLLGHTRDDQAETVLLGLARGSGTRSLAGMAGRSGVYRRPLLDLPREVVVAAAGAAADEDPRLEPWSDPHNSDGRFARVRVRSSVVPILEASLGPGVVEALARTATLAREDADALDAWADRVWTGTGPATPAAPQQSGNHRLREQQQPSELSAQPANAVAALQVAALSTDREPLPAAVVNRVVRRFLISAGCPAGSLTAGHVRAVAALLSAGASPRSEVALPGGRRARREAGAVVVRV